MSVELKLLRVYVNEKGQICDAHSYEPLRFAPDSYLHLLLAHSSQLLEPDAEPEMERQLVVPKGEVLFFHLYKSEWGNLRVNVRVLGDVWMSDANKNRSPKLEPIQLCVVEDVIGYSESFQGAPPFEPFQADTLNQAYSMTSKLYEPKRASHVGNVYREMFVERPDVRARGSSDRTLRELWDAVKHDPGYWESAS